MSKKCHITLIKSIRLENVKFILLKRLPSPKIVHTICLINEGNLPNTYTMFVIFKMSVKWCLFDGIPFNETPMGWLVIVKSRLKIFGTACVLFQACMQIQIIGLNTIFSFCTERSKCFSSNNMFAYFAPGTSTWSATAFLLFKGCYLRSHKNIFQTFCSSKPKYRNILKDLSMFSVRC